MPADPPADPPAPLPRTARDPGDEGVLIRADNGDVVTFDATGLTLRLSDTVLADLHARLGAPPPLDPAEHLGDLDAWNLRAAGDWLRFTARLDPDLGPRDYLAPRAGGDILADAPGPLLALLSFGGPRRAGFNAGPVAFPRHILTPGDDIGAVGLEGTGRTEATAALQHLPHATRDALLAETLLGWRIAARQGLPLFFVRAETDTAARIADMAAGAGYANFLTALDNLIAAAARLGKRPRVLAVGLEAGMEDVLSTAPQIAAATRALMDRITRDMAARDLARPVFLATFEAGTPLSPAPPAMAAQWELAWSHAPHRLAFSAPGYMFDQTPEGRVTEPARRQMAEMDAHALVAMTARQDWLCPLFLLAEAEGREVRVTARALSDLVIASADPFGAGPARGFHITGTEAPVAITGVRVAPDDPRALILTCDAEPGGDAARLHYAHAAPSGRNAGALRDGWQAPSATGATLHRWALPAVLPLNRGRR